MITFPEDPVQVWIDRAHRFALTLMDETVIISPRMNESNEIEASGIGFESLETEPDPNKLQGVARQLSRLKERIQQQFLAAIVFEQLKLKRSTKPVASSRMTYRRAA